MSRCQDGQHAKVQPQVERFYSERCVDVQGSPLQARLCRCYPGMLRRIDPGSSQSHSFFCFFLFPGHLEGKFLLTSSLLTFIFSFMNASLQTTPCKHPIIILKDTGRDEASAMLEFAYTGEVNVAQELLPSLLHTARSFRIKGLDKVENPVPENPSRVSHTFFIKQRHSKKSTKTIAETRGSNTQFGALDGVSPAHEVPYSQQYTQSA